MAVININPPAGAIVSSYEESQTNSDAPAGVVVMDYGIVPAGEVWVIEGGAAWNVTHAPTYISFTINRGGTYHTVCRAVPGGALAALSISSPFCLFPGNRVRVYFGGTILHDELRSSLVGVRYQIELF